MTKSMTGRVALVTGAGIGIGRAIALAFAEEGSDVIVADINVDTGMETVEIIRSAGGQAMFVQCDVTKKEQVEAMVDVAARDLGRLDYACNNAGIVNPEPNEILHELDEAMWSKIMDVNLNGVMLCMKHEIPPMLEQGSGVIINIASLAGLECEPGGYAYTASKHGVVGLTKAAALNYAKVGIRVNAVCPAFVDTPMFAAAPEEFKQMAASWHPIGRVGKPEEIAAAVMWLCSDLSGFVTGSTIVLDGGASAGPF